MAGLNKELSVSGHTVVVEIEDEVISQGDCLEGTLTVIQQGERPLGDLEIRLKEYYRQIEDGEDTLTTRTRARTLQKETLTQFEDRTVVRKHQFSVQLEKARCYPFRLKLPRNCRPTTEHGGWSLSVTMLNDSGLYPDTDGARFNVHLAEEMQAVLGVLVERMKFRELAERRAWDSRTLVTTVHLLPPPVLSERLDGLTLELHQGESGALEVTAIFDLQEGSLGDYFKSLISADLVTREFTFPREQLFDGEGRRNDTALRELLGRALQEALNA